jgi:hypothetical protein
VKKCELKPERAAEEEEKTNTRGEQESTVGAVMASSD